MITMVFLTRYMIIAVMETLLMRSEPSVSPLSTLEVIKGVCSRGLFRGRLGDGFEVGAVALQDGGHEAKEGLLDFHLQGHFFLVPREVCLDGGQIERRVLLWHLTY